jgi:hypothetical protein
MENTHKKLYRQLRDTHKARLLNKILTVIDGASYESVMNALLDVNPLCIYEVGGDVKIAHPKGFQFVAEEINTIMH